MESGDSSRDWKCSLISSLCHVGVLLAHARARRPTLDKQPTIAHALEARTLAHHGPVAATTTSAHHGPVDAIAILVPLATNFLLCMKDTGLDKYHPTVLDYRP
eukprot:3688567-Amphidinium_carterae.1